MTYQEILVEFNNVRSQDFSILQSDIPELGRTIKRVDNLEWAIQSILEKLRDAEPLTK